MIKKFHLLPAACFACGLAAVSAWAQTASDSSLFHPSAEGSLGADSFGATPSPSPKKDEGKDAAATKPAGPTVITSTGDMTYDEKTHMAIFTGPNYGVFVQDPQFTVNCDKLTAIMRHAPAPSVKGKGAPAPKTTPVAQPSLAAKGAKAGSDKASGLQRAIAEGDKDHPVVIVQDKPAENGGQAERDVGTACKADYDADSGDIVLTGWPKVSQGVNTQIATAESTIMTMNRNNNTMKTRGPSRTVIEEQTKPSPGSSSSIKSDQ